MESVLRLFIDDLVPEMKGRPDVKLQRNEMNVLELHGVVDIRHATRLNIAVHRFLRESGEQQVSRKHLRIVVPKVRLGDVTTERERQVLAQHTENPDHLDPETIIDMPEWNADFVRASDRRSRAHIKPRYAQDDDATVDAVAAFVAEHCRRANGIVVHTGAGISAAAGIATYREGHDKSIAVSAALPTFAHYALVALARMGAVDYVCSQNVDGLHRRSGLPADKLSELHGNSYIETCGCCAPPMEFVRPYDVYSNKRPDPRYWGRYVQGPDGRRAIEANTDLTENERRSGIHHITGRACPRSGGALRDSVIHFGENLPTHALEEASRRARAAPLNLVIGSSLLVRPASKLPFAGAGPVAIVAMSCTGSDTAALKCGGVLLRASADAVMERVVRHLGLERFANRPELMDVLHGRVRQRDQAVLQSDGDVPYDGGADGGVVPEALLTGAPSAMAMDVSAPLLQLRQTHEPTRDGQHRWSLSLETVEGHADALQCVKSVSFNLHPTFTPSVYDVRQPPFRVGPFIGWGTFNVKVVVDMGPDTPEICTKFPLTFECSEKVLPVATAA